MADGTVQAAVLTEALIAFSKYAIAPVLAFLFGRYLERHKQRATMTIKRVEDSVNLVRESTNLARDYFVLTGPPEERRNKAIQVLTSLQRLRGALNGVARAIGRESTDAFGLRFADYDSAVTESPFNDSQVLTPEELEVRMSDISSIEGLLVDNLREAEQESLEPRLRTLFRW